MGPLGMLSGTKKSAVALFSPVSLCKADPQKTTGFFWKRPDSGAEDGEHAPTLTFDWKDQLCSFDH